MRIIIEEHKYAAADVKDVLKGIDALHSMDSFSLQSKSNIYITYWVSDTFSLQSKSNLLVLAFDWQINYENHHWRT